MNSEIKNGNFVYYKIDEDLDEKLALFFYDDLNAYVSSKYFNYVIDISDNVSVESIKFFSLLLSLSTFCRHNKGNVIVVTKNSEINSLINALKLGESFKVSDNIDKTLKSFSKK